MIHPPWMDKETHPIERVDELQDHSALITAIDWSKKSSVLARPRLLSASFDGTIRVWKYTRRKWESIRIDATLNENYEAYQGDMKKRPKVNDAIWIKDDQLIAAAVIGEERQNQVKIYNSENGEIVFALTGHREHIRCLKMHPVYNHVIVSTGSDGYIFLWDTRTGKQLQELYFPTTVESGEPVQIHDAKWSKNGMQLVTCDSQGHMSIIGFGTNEVYMKLPGELFFETDYHPLVTDGQGYVIDEHTGNIFLTIRFLRIKFQVWLHI